MMRLLVTTAIALGLGTLAYAGELDDDRSVTNREIQGTMVLRVDKKTNQAAVVRTDEVMPSRERAKSFVKTARFTAIPSSKMKSELDEGSGTSSWYYYPSYGYGGGYGGWGGAYGYGYSCNYYGTSYNPYYYYGGGGYNYYYYGNCTWGGGSGCGYGGYYGGGGGYYGGGGRY